MLKIGKDVSTDFENSSKNLSVEYLRTGYTYDEEESSYSLVDGFLESSNVCLDLLMPRMHMSCFTNLNVKCRNQECVCVKIYKCC